MADFLSLLSSIPGLMADFSGSTSNPYGEQQKQLAGRMAQISAAQTDTQNPLYKQLYGQYQDQNRQSLAQTISEAQAQNRMATANGRTPLFDPNRGGETMFRSLMQGYQGLNNQSDQQTRQALSTAMGGAGSAGNYLNAISPGAAKANTAQLSGYQGLTDILRQAGIGGGQGQTQTQPNNYTSPYQGLYQGKQVQGPANSGYVDPNASLYSGLTAPQSYGLNGGGY